MAHWLHELDCAASIKTKNKGNDQKKEKPENPLVRPTTSEEKLFQWMSVHQKLFDLPKEILVTAPVLDYLDFSIVFILKNNASLKGLGVILSQLDETSKLHIIVYAKFRKI